MKKVLIVGFLAAIFALALIMNYYTPMIADDYALCRQDYFSQLGAWDYFLAIFRDTWFLYTSWGGTFFSGIYYFPLFWIPKSLFNVLNALAFIGVFYITYRHIIGREKSNPYILLIVFFSIIFFIPAYCQSFFWWTGAVAYLFPLFFTLLFLLPYRLKSEETSTSKMNYIFAVGMFVLGLISENGHGPIALMSCGVSLGFLVMWKWDDLRIPFWAISGFIGSLIGCGAFVFSPGLRARVAYTEDLYAQSGETFSIVKTFINNIFLIYDAKIMILILITLLLLSILFSYSLKKKQILSALWLGGIYGFTAIAVIIATCFSPCSLRTFCFVPFFLIIALFLLIKDIDLTSFKLTQLILIILLLVPSSLFMARQFHYARHSKIFIEGLAEFTKKEVAKGNTTLYLPNHLSNPRCSLYFQGASLTWGPFYGAEEIFFVDVPEPAVLDIKKAIEYAQEPENQTSAVKCITLEWYKRVLRWK